MKIIKTKHFSKWSIKNDVSEHSLYIAAQEIVNHKYEADYGGEIIKKRIATKGRGKSSSIRTLVAFKKGKDCLFMVLKKTKKIISHRMKKRL